MAKNPDDSFWEKGYILKRKSLAFVKNILDLNTLYDKGT